MLRHASLCSSASRQILHAVAIWIKPVRSIAFINLDSSVQTMAEDNKDIFGKRKSDAELPITKKQKDDLFVKPGNTIAKQLLDPFGEGELATITLKALWSHAASGHDHCDRFSEYAIDDKNYQGYALAKSMKSLHIAVTAAIDPKEAGKIFDAKVFTAIKAEADDLLPHVQTLCGGQMQKKEGGRLNAFRAPPIDPEAATAAAKEVYAWLHKSDSPLRAVLRFLGQGGLFYAGFANEKMTRAFLSSTSCSQNSFIELCRHRLCQTATVEANNFDWDTITRN